MTKSELKQWVEKRYNHIEITELLSKIDQLDSPEPETIAFTWPIPEGYEPVTRDGRKVEQLVRFDGIMEHADPFRGVVNKVVFSWHVDGIYLPLNEQHKFDLFLRKIAPEMVNLYVNGYMTGRFGAYESQQEALDAARYVGCNYAAVPVTFPKPKP